jgi:acyl-CoA dehydrogenase
MTATDPAKGTRGGISCFLLDMNKPGVRITAKHQTLMGDASCEIVFDNVCVRATNRIGEEGQGFILAQRRLTEGRRRARRALAALA